MFRIFPILGVIFISLLYNGLSANLKLIKTFEMNQLSDKLFNLSYSTEFYNSKNTFLGKYYSLPLQEIVLQAGISDTNSIILEFESADGYSMLFTYDEISKSISAIPPVMLIDKVVGSVGDTVKISENEKGIIDYADLDKELKIATVKKIYCQINKLTRPAKLVFNSFSIIFPMDITDRRWMTNVVRLKIYLFEK